MVHDEIQQSLDAKVSSPIPSDRIFLNRKETALYLGMSPRSLERHANSNYHELKYSRIGGKAVYKLSDVLDFIEDKQKGGAL